MFSPIAKYIHGTPLMVDYTPGSAVAAGAMVIIAGVLGIAHRDIAANTLGSLSLGGAVYDVVNDGSAFADRQPVFFNSTNGQATATSAGNKFIGLAIGAVSSSTAGTTTTRVFVPLPSIQEFDTNNLADPGAGGAITLTQSANVNITSAGVETRSVAAPTYVGEELLISAANVTAGAVTIAFPAAFDTTPHAHIAFSANGTSALFVAVDKAGTPTWALSSNNGGTLSA